MANKNWYPDLFGHLIDLGLGEEGKTAYRAQLAAGHCPETPCWVMAPTGGLRNAPRVQILTRARLFMHAWQLAEQIRTAIDQAGPLFLGDDTAIAKVLVATPPATLGLDESRCWRIATNYAINLGADCDQ